MYRKRKESHEGVIVVGLLVARVTREEGNQIQPKPSTANINRFTGDFKRAATANAGQPVGFQAVGVALLVNLERDVGVVQAERSPEREKSGTFSSAHAVSAVCCGNR